MPFDAAGFPPEPEPAKPPRSNDNVVTALVIIISFLLLALPVSVGALSDIARYLAQP